MIVRELKIIYGERSNITAEAAKLDSPRKVSEFFGFCRDYPTESFFCVCLNNKNKMLGWSEVARGTISETIVHPREVFKPAILSNAAAVVLVHNHPSGETTPSREDLNATRRLKEAGDIIGIPVLDHVIIGDPGFYSMKENGQI